MRSTPSSRNYHKPYVALLDGIVMGGGVGLSIHGSHRVAGDKFRFAMPEVNIGFFPDVGATWFLPRMPGELRHLLRADAASACAPMTLLPAGIATHRIPSSRFAELLDGLCGNVAVDAMLGAFAVPSQGGPIAALRGTIDTVFAPDTVEIILQKLDALVTAGETGSDWAAALAKTVRNRSPTSLKIALAQVRRGETLSFEECMRTEFRIVSRIVYGKDFYEGVQSASSSTRTTRRSGTRRRSAMSRRRMSSAILRR